MDKLTLEQNPLFKDIVIARPEDLKNVRLPTVALHLLVKNGASCVGRLLDNVGPYIHEVVAVVNDTTDNTIEILKEKCKQYNLLFNHLEVTFESHPEFYIIDEPGTYRIGTPLTNEIYSGPFTGRPLLADWAAVRNLGWERSGSKWRLFLDADDEVVDPESIPGLCLALEERNVDLAATRYSYRRTADGHVHSDGFRERLAANVPAIRWVGSCHEVLKGETLTAHVEGSLQVVDRRDSAGSDLRPEGRCGKVLYHEARLENWLVPPRTLVYLAMEHQRSMPKLAAEAINLYLERSSWKEERAWACVMRGEICEAEADFINASAWFERSLAEHPGVKAAFKLCYSRFQE